MKTFPVCILLAGTALTAWQQGPPDPGTKTLIQVAIVCKDIESARLRWAAVLGVDPPAIRTTRPGADVKVSYKGRPSGGQAKLAFFKLGQVVLELIEPVGGPSSWQDGLDAGGGVHHVAFNVEDPERALAWFARAGYPLVHQGRYDGDNGAYYYVDTKEALGVTLELLHSDAKK